MAWYNDVFGMLLIAVLLYLGYFVFDIGGKHKGEKNKVNILQPVMDKLKGFVRWINRQ